MFIGQRSFQSVSALQRQDRMGTTITCYGGVNEIGGNKILLEDGEHRLFFDFGKAFGRYGAYFDGVFTRERAARGLLDPLALGLIPPLRGLLREDLIPVLQDEFLSVIEVPATGRRKKPQEIVQVSAQAVKAFWDHAQSRFPAVYRDMRRENARPVDLVLLSHAHQDHISDLQYVSPAVPVCSSAMTAFISKVLVDVGQAGMSGAPFVNPRVPSAQGTLEAAKGEPYLPRPWVFLEGELEGDENLDLLETSASFWAQSASKRLGPRSQVREFGLRIRHWPVDHSLHGAVGYAVETEAGWVAYTGDLRFHGEHGASTWAFAEGLSELRPSVLLCEGTRLTEPNQTTEAQVYDECFRAVSGNQGELVVSDFAPRNIERLLMFKRIAGETGRCLLVQPKDAYLLRAMHLADPGIPDVLTDRHVGLYDDPKSRQLSWEKNVRERCKERTFTPSEVTRTPGDYILAFSLTDIADMLDLQFLLGTEPGGVYIFSNSQAYDDEQKVDLVRLWNWTQHLGLRMVGLRPVRWGNRGEVTELAPDPGYHASGHAGVDELVEFVRRARPERLIAIHTEMPKRWHELLEGTGVEVILPEYGRPIRL